MSWIISTRQYIPAIIGEAFGGGYFAGYISHTAKQNIEDITMKPTPDTHTWGVGR